MVRILERLGLSFGPDVNAFTQKEQTFYRLDVPKSDDDHLDTALTLMRDIAGNLSIAPAALNAERGVVLAEERLDESPAAEAGKLEQAFYFEGQLAGRRDPMGLVSVITGAPASRVRAYYDAWYRPEDATLIVVGDVDVDSLEKRIVSRFGDWRGRGPPGTRPDLGSPEPRGESVRIIVREGLPLALAVAWARPVSPLADTFARERADLVGQLGLDILEKRLSRMAIGPGAPFVQAGVSREDAIGSARIVQVSAAPDAGRLETGLDALIQEQRRIARFGADAAEFQEALKARRDAVGAAVPSSATKPSAAIADDYLRAVDDDRVIMSAVGALAQFDAEAKSITLAEVNTALRTAFDGSGPLIVLTSPTPVDGGEAGLRAMYEAAAARPVTAREAEVFKPWPYGDFGAPGRVVWRQGFTDLGVTQVRFANGVRLNIRPTTFARNQISVSVRLGDGLLGLPPKRPAQAWLLGALTAGGATELSGDEIQRTLKGLGVSATAAFADDALVLSGATGPRDLPRQLELLTALISRPGYRPEALEHTKNLLAVALPTLDYTPSNVLAISLPSLLHGGDERWAPLPTREALTAAGPGDLPALVDKALKSGAMEVTIVGDVTVERAIAEVARTLGTLPARDDPKPVPASSPTVRPPTGGGAPLVLHHKGRADQAIAYVEWPTQDFYADPHEAHVLVLAAAILRDRLLDRIRVAESASYAPGADAVAMSEELGFGYVEARAEIPPARIDGFYRDVEEIVADMGRRPPTADELLRARAPLLADIARSRETLDFWITYLAHSQADPREIDSIRRKTPDFESVTAAEISAACRRWLKPSTAWKLIVRAAPAPLTPAPLKPAGR
jgi:zinc protease